MAISRPDIQPFTLKPLPKVIRTFHQGMAFSSKVSFELREDDMLFSIVSGASRSSYTVRYLDIKFRSVSEFGEGNLWLRNIGILWVILGLAFAVAQPEGRGLFWSVLGLTCLAYYKLSAKTYTRFPAGECNVLVMRGAQHDDIIAALKNNYKAQLRELGGFYSDETLSQGRARMKYLHEEGALEEWEYATLTKAADNFERNGWPPPILPDGATPPPSQLN